MVKQNVYHAKNEVFKPANHFKIQNSFFTNVNKKDLINRGMLQ